MTNFQKQQEALAALANLCLLQSDKPMPWLPEDLVNAALIMNTVSNSLAWIKYEHLPIEQSELLAEEFGKNMRQSIHLFTGYDMHDLVAKEEGL